MDICSAWKHKFTDSIDECIPKFVPRKKKYFYDTKITFIVE